jgi:hypothetical protein
MTDLLSVQDFARKIGSTPAAVYAAVARQRWPHVKIGRRVYFKTEAVERHIAAHEVPALEAPGPTGRRGRAV